MTTKEVSKVEALYSNCQSGKEKGHFSCSMCKQKVRTTDCKECPVYSWSFSY